MACLSCGSVFVQAQGRGRPRKFCPECRPSKVALGPEPDARACEHCGATFVKRSARFCSSSCQQSAKDERRRIPCAGCGSLIYHSATSRPVGEAQCRKCWIGGHGTRGSYDRGCRCADCRRANGEARRAYLPPGFQDHWIDPLARVELYERDNWVCQLCDQPVDLTVHHLHRDAPTLDHIEPQSFALIPNHDPSNLRTAHRGCNAARGNRVPA